jgi:inner membrane protein involved in colicin E2 resistance
MLVKKILAGLFALIILLKLVFVVTSPQQWMGFTAVLLGHYGLVMAIYLILLVITGYYIFSSLNLVDIALVMFFTSLLMGLALIPYSTLLLSLNEQIMASGMGKAWLAILIWGALAIAILFRVFSKNHEAG